MATLLLKKESLTTGITQDFTFLEMKCREKKVIDVPVPTIHFLSTHLEGWHCHLRNNCFETQLSDRSLRLQEMGGRDTCFQHGRSGLHSFYLSPPPTNRENDPNSGDSFSETETLWEMAFLMFSKSISAAMNQYCQRLSSMQKEKDFTSLTLGSSSHKTQTNNTISKLLMRLFKTFQDSAVIWEPWKGTVHWSSQYWHQHPIDTC